MLAVLVNRVFKEASLWFFVPYNRGRKINLAIIALVLGSV
jgi:hypothetical protein